MTESITRGDGDGDGDETDILIMMDNDWQHAQGSLFIFVLTTA